VGGNIILHFLNSVFCVYHLASTQSYNKIRLQVSTIFAKFYARQPNRGNLWFWVLGPAKDSKFGTIGACKLILKT